MKITFLGATGEVTGSCYLLEDKKTKILVDCGLFQGGRFCDNKNFEVFPFDPKTIDAVVITHAHVDHTGRIPKLVREGFRGKIIATPPTLDFAHLLLLDSEGLLEKEAKYHHCPVIYTMEDVENASKRFYPLSYNTPLALSENLSVTLRDAGHILGSSIIEITSRAPRRKLVFSGDLGNTPAPLLQSKAKISEADYLVVESTYGDRLHEDIDTRKNLLEDIIEETIGKGGVLMIPAFAMERTQEILYEINELVEHHRIPKTPVFVDSPLAIKATRIYKEYEGYYNKSATDLIRSGDDIFKFPGLRFTEMTEESKSINNVPAPKIIIAGSGMSNGGRILHHEKLYLSDPKSTLLIIGYQVHGSLGRALLEGAKQVTIFGEKIEVKATVRAIGGYSAHADQRGLLEWIDPMRLSLKKVFLVHGEEQSRERLGQRLKDELALSVALPKREESFTLD